MSNKYNADPKMIEKAINYIGGAFDWEKTPQGLDYWDQVLQNLEALLDEVKPLESAPNS